MTRDETDYNLDEVKLCSITPGHYCMELQDGVSWVSVRPPTEEDFAAFLRCLSHPTPAHE